MRRRSSRRSGRPVRPMDWGQAIFPLCATTQFIQPCAAIGAYLIPPSTVRGSFTDPTLMTSLLSVIVSGSLVTERLPPAAIYYGLIDWDDINDSVPLDFPDPYNNGNLDWIGIGALFLPNGATGTRIFASTTSERGDGFVQWNSRRRLGNDKGILFSAFYHTQLAGDPSNMAITVNGRFLFKE